MSSRLQSVVEGFDLSPQQRRSLHLRETHPSFVPGVQCLVRLRGPLDAVSLQEAAFQLRLRHEILRTRFARLYGTPVAVQIVDESVSAIDKIRDLTREDESQCPAALARMAEEEFLSL